ncbi:MAG: hypothetical protein ABEK29_04140, partial [Bradymonadaceae bacterium]
MNDQLDTQAPSTPSDQPEESAGPGEEAYPLDSLLAATLAPLEDDYSPDRHGIPEFPDKTYADLEWSKLLDLVADKAVTPEGQALIPKLAPLPGQQAVERRLQELSECMQVMEEDERLPLRGVYDIREAIAHVRKGGTLVADDLEAIGRNCDTASRVERFVDNRRRKYPYLAAIGDELDPCDDLREALNHAIEPGGR